MASCRYSQDSGCLPFTRKKMGRVESWNGNFHGDALVPFPRLFLGRQDQRQFKPKVLELVKTSKWNAHFPCGNSVWEFLSTFQEFPFSRENFLSGGKTKLIFPFTFHLKFRDFLGQKISVTLTGGRSHFNLMVGAAREERRVSTFRSPYFPRALPL